jgi:hypothetical protein
MSPPNWGVEEKSRHHTEMAMFILDGAKDMRYTKGAGFFPESLKSEYHEIKKAMEAFANNAVISGRDEGTANGIALQKGIDFDFNVRVKTKDGTATYRLDRWS